MKVRVFKTDDTEAVIELWESCGLLRAWNDPQLDILRKQSVGAELFLVGTVDNVIVASVMGGYDGHRGWMNYLAVDPQRRKGGFARRIVTALERRLIAIGCPKVNLQVRSDNTSVLAFYRQLGYSVDEVTSMGKRLIPDIANG
jgi:ribosomal protein S18 acetylase RimI-like enzyme